jgi:hypothetical protein
LFDQNMPLSIRAAILSLAASAGLPAPRHQVAPAAVVRTLGDGAFEGHVVLLDDARWQLTIDVPNSPVPARTDGAAL